MLIRHLLKIALIGFVSFNSLSASAEATIGKPAPAFSGAAADGSTVNLSALKGKTVVLEWTNHDCPYVKKHYESGNIPSLQKEATAKGIVWLQVITSAPGSQGNVDGKTAIQINAYNNAKPTNTLLDADGKIGKAYEAQTTPHIFIINPQGVLVYKGGIDSIASTNKNDISRAENYVKAAFSDLAAGKPVAKSSTKPYGCSVKYSS
ncbi:MAG: redoxin domain-containing protein [Methylophilaceae bacterium]|nr:redoxin domain-containing protein [Methylophilaceae bacterium]